MQQLLQNSTEMAEQASLSITSSYLTLLRSFQCMFLRWQERKKWDERNKYYITTFGVTLKVSWACFISVDIEFFFSPSEVVWSTSNDTCVNLLCRVSLVSISIRYIQWIVLFVSSFISMVWKELLVCFWFHSGWLAVYLCVCNEE